VKIKYIIITIVASLISPLSADSQDYIIDTTFNLDFCFRYPGSLPWEDKTGMVRQVLQLPDNTLRISGYFKDETNGFNGKNIIKLLPDGSFDPTFLHYGFGLGHEHVKPYGNYLYAYPGDGFFRIDINTAERDTAFNTPFIWDIAVSLGEIFLFDDGSFMMGGDIHYHWGQPDAKWSRLAMFDANGNYDTSFSHDANLSVLGIREYDEDRLMLSGSFTMYDSVPIRHVARIYKDGALDTTFHSIFPKRTGVIHVQNDGKMLCGGFTRIDNCDSILGLVRINADGSLDSTFNNFNNVQHPDGLWTANGPNSESYYVFAACPTENGRYLFGGQFENYQGYERHGIVLTDSNGFLDSMAFTGTGIDTCINCVTYRPRVSVIEPAGNDRYYVGGEFRGFNGQIVEPLIRIKAVYDNVPDTEMEKEPISIYPNPAYNSITIEQSHIDYIGTCFINILNMEGVLVKSIIRETTPPKWNIDIGNLSPGIYIISIDNGGTVSYTQRIVKL